MKWISWIPTVGGRLSFSVMGDSTNPSRMVGNNTTSGKTRYISFHQKRNLSDSIFGQWLSKLLFKFDGDFWFLVTGEAPDSGISSTAPLKGSITIFMNSSRQWRQFEKSGYSAALNEFKISNQLSCEQAYEALQKNIATNIKEYALLSFTFQLERHGRFELILDDESDGNLTAQENLDIHLIARQCYYFFKDFCHIHQHHHPSTDTLIDLYKDGSGSCWRENILRVLYRKVLSHKRNKTIQNFDEALGILPYIESFQNIEKDHFKENKTALELEFTLVKESITTKRNQLLHELQNKQLSSDQFRSTLLVVLGLILSFLSLGAYLKPQVHIPADSVTNGIISWILNHPDQLSLIVPVMTYAYLVLTGAFPMVRWRIFKATLKLLLTFKRNIGILVSLIISLTTAAAVIWINYEKLFIS